MPCALYLMAPLTPINLKTCPTRISCHAFKLGISSEQDAGTTMISSLLTLRFYDLNAESLIGGLRRRVH